MTTNRGGTRSKITLWVGVALMLAYLILVVGVRAMLGVDHEDVDLSASNAFKAFVIPVGAACSVLLIALLILGNVRDLFFERPSLRITRPIWLWLVPVFLICATVGGYVSTTWDDFTTGTLVVLLIGTLGVGFGEELAVRGFVLVGARSRFGEAQAWLVSTFIFAIAHFGNIITGEATGDTITQVVFAFLTGSSLYLVRRLTGVLFVGMLLHGLFDFSAIVSNGVGEGDAAGDIPGVLFIALILSWIATIPALLFVFWRRKAPPATMDATP